MKYSPFLLLFLLFFSCTAPQSKTDLPEGWTSLFNGVNLDGWQVKNVPADDSLSFWSVEDGAIVANSLGHPKHDYVWLLSDKEYSDFTLRLQFQMYREYAGNSGVQIRSRYDDAEGWLNGPQVDINPPGPWRTGLSWDETRGNQWWLFPTVPKDSWPDSTYATPGMVSYYSDQGCGWNDLEITAVGTRLYSELNGVQIMNYDGAGVLDDSTHQARRVGMVGHIALQIHTGDQTYVKFKNIMVREQTGAVQ